MGSAFLFLTTLYKQQTNSRRRWKKNKVISGSNSKSIIAADDHLIFSKQHPSIHLLVRFFFKKQLKWISQSQWEAWHYRLFLSLFRFHLKKSRTVCVSSRCAPALNRLRNNKIIKNEIANIRREQIIHVERRRRFYLFVISWWWVINSIENGRKRWKKVFLLCLSRYCEQVWL